MKLEFSELKHKIKILMYQKLHFKILIYLLIIKLGLAFTFERISYIYFNSMINNNTFKFNNVYEKYFLLVLIAPIFETWFNYYLINFYAKKILLKLKFNILEIEKNIYYIIFFMLITSIIFGYNHNYNKFYMLYAFTTSFIYSYYYLKFYLINKRFAFWSICLLHALYNLSGNLLENLINFFLT